MKTLYCMPECWCLRESDPEYTSDVFEVTKYIIPDCVTEIADYAFCRLYIEGPSEVVLPERLASVGEYAFSGFANGYCSIESIEIPAGITEIKAHTFEGNGAVRRVTLPAGLLSIEEKAFAYCDMEEVYFKGTSEQWLTVNIAEGNDAVKNAVIYCIIG